VNHLVLSGTPSIVPSGTRSTCYRGPKSGETCCLSTACRASNFSNLDSFGIYLTNFAFSRVGEKTRSAAAERVVIVALLNQNGGVGKTTVTLDPVGGWPRQRLRVVVIDAGRKGENENCWLDWPEQRANKGLTRFFVIDHAPDVARSVNHIVIDGPPRLETLIGSMLRVADVVVRTTQPWPSDKGASGETLKRMKQSHTFGLGLRASFVLNRCGLRALIAPERAEALAERDPPAPFSRVGRRMACVDATRSSQLLSEADKVSHAARADDRPCCRRRKHRAMTARDCKSAFALRPSDPKTRSRKAEDRAVESAAKALRFIPRRPIDVAPELRGRIKVMASHRALTVTETPCGPLAREFPQTQGGRFDGRSHRG
jgi:chromosome partitioning protein